MTLVVHGVRHSTYTQLVLTTLAELGVHDYKMVLVDMDNGQHKSPEFLKLQVQHCTGLEPSSFSVSVTNLRGSSGSDYAC